MDAVIPDYNDVDDCRAESSVELLEVNLVGFSVFWKSDNLEIFPEWRDVEQHCDIQFWTHLSENLM